MQEFINKRILLVNKFYYNRGGDCVAMLNTEQLLKEKGHQVAVFSMKYSRNIPSEWEDYFPDEVNFSARDLSGIIKAASRLFSPKDVAIQFKSLLNVFRPDIVHLHNIHSYLSPIVASIAHQKGIRVVWTMHDYKLICPAYSCLNHGLVCERCFKNKHRVFIHKCMKNSYPASLLGWMEAVYWNKKKLIKFTHRFISPSRFLKTKMIEAGFPDNMIEVLPNFIPSKKIPSSTKKDYYCYVGRISGEKGIDTLLNAASQLPYPLKIIGDGPLLNTFRRVFNHENIDFMGYLPQDRVYEITKEARCVVMPSVWYENNPLSAIEALSIGTPVLGSRIGGIPELIDEGFNGFLCTPKNTSELQEKIELCFNHFHKQYNFAKIAEQAQNKFDSESFYKKLLNIYDR